MAAAQTGQGHMVEGSRLRRFKCSSCTDSDTSRLALYLARIFMRGRSLSHHCSLGILCLRVAVGETFALPSPPTLPSPSPARYALEVRLVPELHHRLEDDVPLVDPQHTDGVICVKLLPCPWVTRSHRSAGLTWAGSQQLRPMTTWGEPCRHP